MTACFPPASEPRSAENLPSRLNIKQGERKRRRVGQACLPCRRRKSRCNGAKPACSSCTELEYACEYPSLGPQTLGISSSYIKELESRLATLENRLDEPNSPHRGNEQSRNRTNEESLPVNHVGSWPESDDDLPSELHSMRTSPAYLHQGPLTSSSTRAPELVDPRILVDENDEAYFGSSSLMAFAQAVSFSLTCPDDSHGADYEATAESGATIYSGGLAVLRPGSPVQQDPSSKRVNEESRESMYMIPSHATAVKLIDRYFDNTGLLWPYLQKQSILKTLDCLRKGTSKVPRTCLGLLNMIFAMAIQRTFGPAANADQCYEESYAYYKRAAKVCQHQVMSNATLETVQYLLLRTQYLQGSFNAHETWATHGLAVKAALQVGLHLDDINNRYEPALREIRRRTWFTCFILDRTLSMAFGRPPSIPNSYIRLGPPLLIDDTNHRPDLRDEVSTGVKYFGAAVSLSSVLGDVLEALYDNNLVVEPNKSILQVVADVLVAEDRLIDWRSTLPLPLQPKALGTLLHVTASDAFAARVSTILCLRYNNFRSLVHRPVLMRLLRALGQSTEVSSEIQQLHQIGKRSVDICYDSSTEVISTVHAICAANLQVQLLGTWWCTLYYTFIAGLHVFSAFLISKRIPSNWTSPSMTPVAMVASMQNAISALESLGQGNKTATKCKDCLQRLHLAMSRAGQYGSTMDFHDSAMAQEPSLITPSSSYISQEPLVSGPEEGWPSQEFLYDFGSVFDQDMSFLNELTV